jgi:ribonuclease Z
MRPIITAELVNGPCGDPALYLDFRFERRALMMDLGDVTALPPKKLLRLTDVFVSHAHMDHFSGFDRLLRVCLGRDAPLRLYGPPGFADRVGHKLDAYTWNRIENYPNDFTLLVHELHPGDRILAARFRSRARFEREPLCEGSTSDGVLLDEPAFRVRAQTLDHGIPCLGFAFEEKLHVSVWNNRLAEMGLPAGPWLKELKQAVMGGVPEGASVRAWWHEGGEARERRLPLGVLKAAALQVVPGEKLCYVTDIVYHDRNEAAVARLAAGAERLYIECVFLEQDAQHGARKGHLTAAQAGRMARAAAAKSVVPFHFSPRYLGREAELHTELQHARGAT